MPRAPLGVSTRASSEELREGDAIWFAAASLDDPTDANALAALLPDPNATPGAIVVVSPEVSRGGFLSKLFGRGEGLPRAVRGSALLLRGFASIAGGVDPSSGLDLCWGVAPARPSREDPQVPTAIASSSGTST